MICPSGYTRPRQRRVKYFTSLVVRLPSSSGRLSNRYNPTLYQTSSSNTFAHSLMVFVLRDQAGRLPDYIKRRLRWLGDSFRMHLRDTSVIQHQHVDALCTASQEVLDLIAALSMDVLTLSTTMANCTNDPDMREYVDKN
jgi:hypothetical protein